MARTLISNLRGGIGPTGVQGVQGLPGTNATPSDAAVAGYISTPGTSSTKTAMRTVLDVQAIDLASAAKIPIHSSLNFKTRVGAERLAGGQYRTDITPMSMHVRGAGPTYYVDPVNGSNANNGLTWATAVADPAYASLLNSSAAAEIVVRGGFYTRAQCPQIYRNIIIRAEEGTRPIFAAVDTVPTWTVTGASYVYKVTKTGLIGVFDQKFRDADGDPTELIPVANTSAVASTPGSWYSSGTELFIRLADNRAPDSSVLVNMNARVLTVNAAVVGNYSAYYEGIEFWVGADARLTEKGTDCRFLAKNCKFKFSGAGNGLTILGMALTVLENCEASKNYLDGFNYHESSGRLGEIVEINCVGRKNGKIAGSQNGSSAHDGMNIVRVGGLYELNAGGNIADVSGTKTHNIGVTAKNSTGYDYDFYTETGMWMDSCVATGSTVSLYANLGGTIYLRNTVYTGTKNVADGTVTTY